MKEQEELDAAKIVSSAIIGADFQRIIVNDKVYIISPPTIYKIAGATYWLSENGDGKTIKELLTSMKDSEHLARALSWFIQGDEGLTEELCQGTFEEVVEGLETAFALIGMENFIKLSVLKKSAKILIAKPK